MNSRLRTPSYPFEETPIVRHLHEVERRVRLMCRVSQVFVTENMTSLNNLEADMEDASAWCELFYEFVDEQMNVLQRLWEGIEDEGPSRVTLKQLQDRRAFIDGPYQQSGFRTRKAYEEYCNFYHYEPEPDRNANRAEKEE